MISLTGLDGGQLDVPLEGIISPGSIKVVRGAGMPVSKEGGRSRGNMHIKFEVDFPKKNLSEAQKQHLQKALG